MPPKLLVILLLIVINGKTVASSSGVQDELIAALIFFRHGDRTVLYDFPKNHVNVTKQWPIGMGQLTETGKEQAYALGQFLRNKYGGLIRNCYHPHDIYVLSSDFDRSLMTAMHVTNGLYEASSTSSWWRNLLSFFTSSSSPCYAPVPIRTLPYAIDNLIGFGAPCPRYKEALDYFRHHGMGHEMDKKYSALYAHLSKHTGIPIANMTFEKVTDIFDTLYVQHAHGLGLPEWAAQPPPAVITEKNIMRKLAELTFRGLIHNDITMKLRGGPILREIVRNLEAHTAGGCPRCKPLEKYKLRLYSGHDTTVAGLMQTLGVYNNLLVPYTGAVMIDLYKRQLPTPAHFIKVFYRNCTHLTDFVYEMPIPGCQDITGTSLPGCSLSRLKESKKDILQSDWKKLCKSCGSWSNCGCGLFCNIL